MSYIGNARSLLVIGSNTRDDLVSSFNGQVTFELSQEVPGGHEGNVTVLRQRFITKALISDTTSISIGGSDRGAIERLVTCTNASISAALSIVRQGDTLQISIPTDLNNTLNDSFVINEVIYSGTSIKIYLEADVTGTINTVTNTTSLSLTTGREDNWNILEPEIDYTIGATHRQITLSMPPVTNDKIYVLHKGEATYNFVPSSRSVGPEQLSENLRNFQCDRYTSVVGNNTFSISGTDASEATIVDAKSLLVTVDGSIKDSDGIDTEGMSFTGDWQLNSTRDINNRQTISFHSALSAGRVIRILNLGFSTISRRASFAAGQAGVVGPASVGTIQLKNDSITEGKLRTDSVATSKIKDNAVTGAKILLENNESLNAKSSSGTTELGLIRLGTDNTTELIGNTSLSISISGEKKFEVTTTLIKPTTTNSVSIGSSTNKFKDLHLSGDMVTTGSIVTSTGQTVSGINLPNLNTTVTDIKNLINSGYFSPIGSIMMWPTNVVPTGWHRCDGSSLSIGTYPELHGIIGTVYGPGASPGSTFNLPDFITRFPVGGNTTATNLGNNDGVTQSTRTISHSHTSDTTHTHTFLHTHGVPGHRHENTGVPTAGVGKLSILSSGGHATSLDHTHTGNTPTPISDGGATNPWLDSIQWTEVPASRHYHNVKCGGPSVNGQSVSLDHHHRSWPANSGGVPAGTSDAQKTSVPSANLRHTHPIDVAGWSSSTTYHRHDTNNTSGKVASEPTGGSVVDSINPVDRNTMESANTLVHTHDINMFYTGGATSTTATTWAEYHSDTKRTTNNLAHDHIVTTGAAITNAADGGHTHAGGLVISYWGSDRPPAVGTPDYRGVHAHPADMVQGSIGLISTETGALAPSGNSVFNTTTQSANTTTNPVTGTHNTGPSVSPHLVVNFIIKATNTVIA